MLVSSLVSYQLSSLPIFFHMFIISSIVKNKEIILCQINYVNEWLLFRMHTWRHLFTNTNRQTDFFNENVVCEVEQFPPEVNCSVWWSFDFRLVNRNANELAGQCLISVKKINYLIWYKGNTLLSFPVQLKHFKFKLLQFFFAHPPTPLCNAQINYFELLVE
mgnify:CR=1 FL=1